MNAGLLGTTAIQSATEFEQSPLIVSIIRSLQRVLDSLSEKYGIVSLGVFGSHLRGEARPDSDLDVLVEFRDKLDYRVRDQLQQELSEIVGVAVDLVPFESLSDRPYFGRNVLRSVLWLLKGGTPRLVEDETLLARIHDVGDDMEPKREYMDFINDMITSMQNAIDFSGQVEFSKLIKDKMRMSALKYEVQTIGEAANKIPEGVRNLYPQIPWEKMIGMRNRLVHDYPNIDYSILWQVLHEDIPHDLLFVQDMFEQEKRRRHLKDIGNDDPTV